MLATRKRALFGVNQSAEAAAGMLHRLRCGRVGRVEGWRAGDKAAESGVSERWQQVTSEGRKGERRTSNVKRIYCEGEKERAKAFARNTSGSVWAGTGRHSVQKITGSVWTDAGMR